MVIKEVIHEVANGRIIRIETWSLKKV